MSGRLGRMLFSMGACALLVSFGCGEAPAVEPAEGLKQTRQALSTGADVLVQSVSGPSSALPEGPLELQVGVCNQGPEPTGIFVSGFLSPSSAIPSPDTEVIEISSGYTWLMPGECSSGPLPSHGYVLPEGAWYLGARATGDWYEDPNPSNNARIGNRIGIGTAPDFLVQTVSGPVSVTPGAPFTASVTVCNPGTVSGGTDVQLVLSRDTTITFSPSAPESQQDLPLASFASGTLEPGQCATQQLPTSVQPSREGNWYLGAVADPANAVPELIETNNTRASKAVGIGYRPDFTVQSVSSPSNLVPGGPFTSSVKVCNQGTVSGSTQVQLVLSEDTTIRFSPTGDPALQDLPLASFASGTLAAGQCAVQQVQASAQPPHDGSWYLGAVADPANTTLEFSESNNTRASKAVGIGYQPDFLIQTVSSPPSVLPGVPFTASVKVCNQGTASGDAQVLLVLSEDTTIRFSPMGDPALQDWPLTSFDTGPLAAGECTTQQVETSVVPPFDASNWYLGALADPDNTVPEFNETNNTRASGALNIGYWPDFIVQSVSGPVSLAPGDAFTVSVKVCNQGTVAGDFYLEVFLSSDREISELDSHVGTGYPEYGNWWLEPGQCLSKPVSATATVSEGAWYVGALVRGSWEFVETNNARAGGLLHVGYQPDYVIQSVSGPEVAAPGSSITASVKVCNQGTVAGGDVQVQLVLSEDTLIRFSSGTPPAEQDLPLASFSAGPLAPGQCQTQEVQATVQPPHEGLWYLGAVADPGNQESEFNEDNNTRAGKALGIGHQPDFIIQAVSGPASLVPGDVLTASLTVCNQGTEGSGGTEVQLVLSEDSTIRFSPSGSPAEQDLPLAAFASGTLAAGQCKTQQVQASVSAPHEGVWYLGAVADPSGSVLELLETNNVRASKPVGIGHQPDLVVQAVRAPLSAWYGTSVTIPVTVCNQGTAGSGDTQVQLIVSEDTILHIDPNELPWEQDVLLTTLPVGPLAAGQCTTQQVQIEVRAWNESTWYYLGAVVDPDNSTGEFLETNNTRVSARFYFGYQPDLMVQAVSAPVSLLPGEEFTASVTVCNQGSGVVPGSYLELVLSEDTLIHSSLSGAPAEQDLSLAVVEVWWLAPGQCTTQQVQTSVQPPHEGAWYLGAVADAFNSEAEFNEDNNTRASKPVGIGYQPDYIIRAVSGPASVSPGAPFTASVTVCNQGAASASSAQVQLVLSEDSTIHFSPNGSPEEQDLPLASFSAGPLAVGQCTTQQVHASVQPSHEGTWYLGAVADPANDVPELLESNNALASKPFGLGHQPDFVIQAVSGPVSVLPGAPFTASVTVCNQGTEGSGGTEVQLVLSEDSTLRLPTTGSPAEQDLLLVSFASGPLAAGQCATQQVETQVQPSHEGAWYLGAVADPANAVPELLETNNTRTSKPVGIGQRADIVIQAVSGPLNTQAYQSFLAEVTVCNQGTAAGWADGHLLLSRDTHFDNSSELPQHEQDFTLGTFWAGLLEPGQCATLPVEAWAGTGEERSWYLGAVADPSNYVEELNETNNTRSGGLIGIGYRADYIVKAVNAPVSVVPGEQFMASVTVCNQGNAWGGGTDVQLVLSGDATIQFASGSTSAAQDLPLNSFFLGVLEEGQCRTQQVQASAQPPHEGTWYLGAVVDPGNAEHELNEDNNTRASEPLGFGHRPDFVIQAVSGPANARLGAPLTASVTVCNQGTVSGGADVQLVLSEDSTIRYAPSAPWEEQDLPLVSFASETLAPGQCAAQQVQTNAQPPHEGLWYLGAVADPGNAVPEFFEDNNTRASTALAIGDQPDFVIQSVSIPPSVLPGAPFAASVTVCNEGTVSSGTDVQLVLSEDATVVSSSTGAPEEQDLLLSSFASGTLAAGQCRTQQVQLSVQPPHEGAWYLGAVADLANTVPEFLELNNGGVSKPLGIGVRPDFIVQAVSGPASAEGYSSFIMKVTVCNQGTLAGSTGGHLVLSRDSTVESSPVPPPGQGDVLIGYLSTVALEPGQCVTQEAQTGTPGVDGDWYLGAVVDADNTEPELNETNNGRAGRIISLGYKPDYIIQAVSGPTRVVPGEPFTASVTVCNQGTRDGWDTQVVLVLSEDASIHFSPNALPAGQDLLLGSFSPGLLGAGQCQTQQVETHVQPPHEGTWYLGAVADPADDTFELNEANNSRASHPVGVGHRPDFLLQAVSGPASISPGVPFAASVKVCNQGTVGGDAQVQLVLSEDATISFTPNGSPEEQDLPLTSFASGLLEPGQCTTQQVQASVQPPHEGAWYLGAVADPANAVPELIETNNTRASKLLGLGSQPDFVIQEVSGPPSVLPGQPLMATVKVCNQGTMSSGTDVQLVLSQNTTIHYSPDGTPSEQDLAVAAFFSGSLEPGQCMTQQLEATAQVPQEGVWYLGAVADPANAVPELIETNNTRASQLLGIGSQADLIVQAVSAPNSAAPEGGSLEVTVTVCNQGTTGANAYAEFYLSQDKAISILDTQVGWASLGMLGPGQCTSARRPSSLYVAEGDWYLGAIAHTISEPEFSTENNARTGAVVRVGYAPDFLIQSVSAPPGVVPGAPFTASVRVCNQGTESGSTDVQLVLSGDATIRFSPELPPGEQDLPLASFSAGPLSPGECQTQEVELSLQPSRLGTWYLGAVADSANAVPEFFEDNNTRASKPVGIGSKADFIIQAVSGPPSVLPGALFTAEVTVCNQGTSGGSADVVVLLSEDTSIRFSGEAPSDDQDQPLASFSAGRLEPGQCATQQVQASVQPSLEGAWYLGAVADPAKAVPELFENNNTLASEPMGIGSGPDFVLQALDSPRGVRPGGMLSAEFTLCNQGTQSGGTDVQLLLSADTTVSASSNGSSPQDLLLTSVSTGLLAPGQCVTRQAQAVAPSQLEGSWYLGLVADPANTTLELLETNNTRVSQSVFIGYQARFVVQALSHQRSVVAGGQLRVDLTVCNQGTAYGTPQAAIVLSRDREFFPSDTVLAPVYLSGLSAGECHSGFLFPAASAPEGLWYLGAAVFHEYVPENLHDVRFGDTVAIGTQPDFVIQAVSGPVSALPGQPFTASVKVCNQGTVSGGTEVQLVLSSNGTAAHQDLPLASFSTGELLPGRCMTQQVETQVLPPHEGAWYLGAVADPSSSTPEFLETNNTRVSAPVGIGQRPDFIVQTVSGPASLLSGAPLRAEVTVCNQGTVGGSTDVQLVASRDTTIRFSSGSAVPDPDLPLTAFSTGVLEPGQCATQQVQASAQVPHEGAWYLGAVADPGSSTPELLEANNSQASAPVGIGHQPDFIVQSVSAPPSAEPWQQFTVAVTVCNQGTLGGDTDVQVVLSRDTTLAFASASLPPAHDVLLSTFATGLLEPGQCTTRQVQTRVVYDAGDGVFYLGAIANPGYSQPELVVSNNARVGGLIGIGRAADLFIPSMSGPASATSGAPFTAEVTVCNQGTNGARARVYLVLSEDTDIHYGPYERPEDNDVLLGFFPTDVIMPGQCSTLPGQVSAQVPHNGLWYLGAVVNADWGDLIVSNNTASAGAIQIHE